MQARVDPQISEKMLKIGFIVTRASPSPKYENANESLRIRQ